MNLFELAEQQAGKRNNFQSKHSASDIKAIELKFLDSALRTRNDHPAKALTADEREIYADFLQNVKNDINGAESFRSYKPVVVSEKKRKSARGKGK
jgi:hypothetical protein